ncbi:M24 family metallopeptidase [Klebsiella pneumoniae]|nr:M24 family metallopeptidase [Klebsiella pneumoniae]
MSEYQLEGEILHEFNRHGARFPSYNTTSLAAAKTAVFCTTPKTNLNPRDGDLVLIDAGCEYRGYAGDITRTFPVNGKSGPAAARDLTTLCLNRWRLR